MSGSSSGSTSASTTTPVYLGSGIQTESGNRSGSYQSTESWNYAEAVVSMSGSTSATVVGTWTVASGTGTVDNYGTTDTSYALTDGTYAYRDAGIPISGTWQENGAAHSTFAAHYVRTLGSDQNWLATGTWDKSASTGSDWSWAGSGAYAYASGSASTTPVYLGSGGQTESGDRGASSQSTESWNYAEAVGSASGSTSATIIGTWTVVGGTGTDDTFGTTNTGYSLADGTYRYLSGSTTINGAWGEHGGTSSSFLTHFDKTLGSDQNWHSTGYQTRTSSSGSYWNWDGSGSYSRSGSGYSMMSPTSTAYQGTGTRTETGYRSAASQLTERWNYSESSGSGSAGGSNSGVWTVASGTGTEDDSGATNTGYSLPDGTYSYQRGDATIEGTWDESGWDHSAYSGHYDKTLGSNGSWGTTGDWTKTNSGSSNWSYAGDGSYSVSQTGLGLSPDPQTLPAPLAAAMSLASNTNFTVPYVSGGSSSGGSSSGSVSYGSGVIDESGDTSFAYSTSQHWSYDDSPGSASGSASSDHWTVVGGSGTAAGSASAYFSDVASGSYSGSGMSLNWDRDNAITRQTVISEDVTLGADRNWTTTGARADSTAGSFDASWSASWTSGVSVASSSPYAYGYYSGSMTQTNNDSGHNHAEYDGVAGYSLNSYGNWDLVGASASGQVDGDRNQSYSAAGSYTRTLPGGSAAGAVSADGGSSSSYSFSFDGAENAVGSWSYAGDGQRTLSGSANDSLSGSGTYQNGIMSGSLSESETHVSDWDSAASYAIQGSAWVMTGGSGSATGNTTYSDTYSASGQSGSASTSGDSGWSWGNYASERGRDILSTDYSTQSQVVDGQWVTSGSATTDGLVEREQSSSGFYTTTTTSVVYSYSGSGSGSGSGSSYTTSTSTSASTNSWSNHNYTADTYSAATSWTVAPNWYGFPMVSSGTTNHMTGTTETQWSNTDASGSTSGSNYASSYDQTASYAGYYGAAYFGGVGAGPGNPYGYSPVNGNGGGAGFGLGGALASPLIAAPPGAVIAGMGAPLGAVNLMRVNVNDLEQAGGPGAAFPGNGFFAVGQQQQPGRQQPQVGPGPAGAMVGGAGAAAGGPVLIAARGRLAPLLDRIFPKNSGYYDLNVTAGYPVVIFDVPVNLGINTGFQYDTYSGLTHWYVGPQISLGTPVGVSLTWAPYQTVSPGHYWGITASNLNGAVNAGTQWGSGWGLYFEGGVSLFGGYLTVSPWYYVFTGF
ncbi:RHS repeat domain-containing protein [Zavarzinella formosa]|uniref:hypothetical protein n=1 Tax=Zavarzinella formosa TaxID=360055 RepID=UPI0012FC36B8|nr:hypothetical protein [Zavarzinella formosa]